MQELNLSNLLSLNKKIAETDDKILEIRERVTSPKNQIISDMPRGGGTMENALDNALSKIEHYETRKAYLNDLLVSDWLICEDILISCNISPEQIELFRYRYFYALPWKKCIAAMAKHYSNESWSESKGYRLHREALSRCIKNGVKVC